MRDLRRARFFGLIGGLSMSFLGAIGMVELFNTVLLIDPILRMGDLFLYGVTLAMGYLAGRGEKSVLEEPVRTPVDGAVNGLLTGLLAGVATAVFILIVDRIDLVEFFPSMGNSMVDEISFGAGVPSGLILIIAVSSAVGAVGGLISSVPNRVRLGVARVAAWVIGLAFLEVVVADILEVRAIIRFIYGPTGGLKLWSAAVIGVLAWWLSERYQGRIKEFTSTVRESDPRSRIRLSVYGIGLLAVIVLPMLLGGILNELLINVSLFVLLGLGLNIVVGYAGLLDLGYVAFFAVGAYGAAVLTSPVSATINPELGWWLSIPVIIGLATLAGLLVGTPVIRMRGDYLAIVTLGFGEIVRILLLSDWLQPYFGGSQGIRRIPGIPVPGFGNIGGTRPQLFVYFTLLFVAIAAYISYRAQNSRIGRSWAAMREDEDVAEATGIGTVQAKLLAFVTGAIVASFAGALFSAKVGVVFTNSFDVLVSIVILVVVIVGGMGSIPGVIVGSVVLIGVLGGPKSPGLLAELSEYKLLFYGAILVFMMLRRPEGLLPSVRRSRELHQEEMLQDAWLDKGGPVTEEAATGAEA